MAVKKLKFTQAEFDVKKWLDSEKGTDTCGTYDFCQYCTKEGDTPCEDAVAKEKKALAAAKRKATLAAKKASANK